MVWMALVAVGVGIAIRGYHPPRHAPAQVLLEAAHLASAVAQRDDEFALSLASCPERPGKPLPSEVRG
jgi:hypothetical protein